MLRTHISSFILSKVDINRFKYSIARTPVINALFKIFSQALIDYKFPAHIFIETTRACNLKCACCPRTSEDIPSGSMKLEVFCKIIDEATAYGARNFCLHMFGEPLLHPRIIDMVRYIKEANKKHSILLTTNGFFLNSEIALGLLEQGVDKIVISFISLREERLRQLTGNAQIEIVINNIKDAIAIKGNISSKTKIFMRLLLSDDTLDEKNDFIALAKKIGALAEVRNTHNYSGVIKNNYAARVLGSTRHPCYHLWYSPAITWDGKVVICCSDWNYSEVLGDIATHTLAEIWQGQRIKELRALHCAGAYQDIPLCRECNVWSLYPDIFFKFQKK